jgi:hypothetical protein
MPLHELDDLAVALECSARNNALAADRKEGKLYTSVAKTFSSFHL